jgi:hypothetical protein
VALAVGGRLGHFDVIAPLGAGGMGEVYRARDTRLGRDVALKVLPETFAQDTERRSRFEREARLLATLSHPGIAGIHGVEDDAGTPVLVMELVEGETLDRRLQRSRVPVRQALEVGRRVAEALGAAHEKGIIHRDLKPSNVMLTPEGRVKLLDFGLAKALAGEDVGSEGLAARPDSDASTFTGVVIGTAPYMSPEQVRGEGLDRRADIWSFGCVLYEMLAGARAFSGRGPEAVAAVLEREPEWQALPPDTPVKVQQLLRRCLQKDRGRRLHDIADARIELDEALAESTTGPTPSTAPAAPPGRLRQRLWLAPLLLAVLAGTHASLFLWGRRTAEAPIPTFTRVTFRRGVVDSARFSSDGQTIVYSARWGSAPAEVFSQRLGSAEARPFGLAGARLVAIAGAEMAVLRENGTLVRVPLEGGTPREVLADVADAAWAGDAARFAVVRQVAFMRQRLEYPIGKVLYETAGVEAILNPRLSPAGDRIAFVETWVYGDTGDVVTVDGAGHKRVLSSGWEDLGGLAWSPDGREVWFSAARVGGTRALYAVELSGKERLIARMAGNLVLQDIARDGRVLLTHGQRRIEMRGRMAADGVERDLSWLDGTNTPILSPDGCRLLFEEWGEGGGARSATYLRREDGSPPVRLAEGGPYDVSPDWKWVLCQVGWYRHPDMALKLIPIGAGEQRALARGPIRDYVWAFWHPDGKRIVIRGSEAGRPTRLFIQEVPDGEPRPFGPEAVPFMAKNPVSPDGRLVLARAAGDGPPWAFYPIEGGEPSPVEGLGSDDWPLGWAEGGRELFVLASRSRIPTPIVRLDLRTHRTRPWLEMTPPDRAGVSQLYNATITPDGRFYAYSFMRTLSDLYLVEGLR